MNLRPALLITSLLALPLVTLAQPPSPPPEGSGPQAGHHGKPSPERMAAHMQRELNLSDDQTAKVKDLMEDFTRDMEALHDKHEAALEKILTPEQLAKFEQMKRDRHERFRGHTGKPGAPPPPGAQQPDTE